MSNTPRALDAFFYTRLPPVLTRFLCVGGICIIVYLIKRCSVRKGVKTAYVCQIRSAPLTPFSILAFPPVLTRFLCVGGICIIVYLIKRCSVRKGAEATCVCQTRSAPLTPFSILAFPPFFLSISYNCALDYLLIAHRAVLSIFMFLGN